MARKLEEIIASLPVARRERVSARYRELKDEVESLSELRPIAGRAQADLAAEFKIEQSPTEPEAD